MSDKVLDLIEKMYIELKQGQEAIKNDINGIKKDITDVKEDVQTLSNQMVRFENGVKEDIKALYDGYKQTYELVKIIKS